MCPWCHSVVSTLDWEKGGSDDQQCPNCKESKHLCESTYDIGDTECCRCGALFLNTIGGKDSIVGWNEDTKGKHDEMIRACYGV